MACSRRRALRHAGRTTSVPIVAVLAAGTTPARHSGTREERGKRIGMAQQRRTGAVITPEQVVRAHRLLPVPFAALSAAPSPTDTPRRPSADPAASHSPACRRCHFLRGTVHRNRRRLADSSDSRPRQPQSRPLASRLAWPQPSPMGIMGPRPATSPRRRRRSGATTDRGTCPSAVPTIRTTRTRTQRHTERTLPTRTRRNRHRAPK